MSQFDSEEFCVYDLEEDLLHKYDNIMKLKIFIDSLDEELKNKYAEAIHNHNLKLQNNIDHIDAGFDLLAPDNYEFLFIDFHPKKNQSMFRKKFEEYIYPDKI